MPEPIKGTLTCPQCDHQQEMEIPIDACQFFYLCDGCQERIKAKSGDCCVFCSYGDRRCPTAPKK